MKNLFKSFQPLNLLYNILVLAVLFTIAGVNVAYAVPVGLATGTVLSLVSMPKASFWMPIQKTVWENTIQDNLFKNNAFLKTFTQADKENINGRTVIIPNAGQPSNVVKNRKELPATISQREDVPTSYEIAEFTSDPILIENSDTVELSYDKRASVLRNDQAKLNQEVAEDMLLNCVTASVGTAKALPATSILSTSGDAVNPTAPTATAQVKAYTLADLQRARAFFIRQNTWMEGQMYAVITAEAEAQLFPAGTTATATYMASVTEEERRNGVMYKTQGFQIFTRSTALLIAQDNSFKPMSAEAAQTDVEGILLYNGNQVEFALGDIKFFEHLDAPAYFGDYYSFLVRAGGRALREKFEGVAVIKQALAN